MKRFKLFAIAAAGLLLSACSNDDGPNNKPNPNQSGTTEQNDPTYSADGYNTILLNQNQRENVTAVNNFTMKMFAQNSQDEGFFDNSFESAYSLFVYLSMAANGDSSGEIANFLIGTDDAESIKNLNNYNHTILHALPRIDKNVVASISNSVWTDPSAILNEGFRKTMAEIYNAEFYSLVLSTEDAKNQINTWVYDKTYGMIKGILMNTYPPGTMATMFNAVYFKGMWNYKFDVKNTKDDKFTCLNGEVTNVPMMNLADEFMLYYNDDNAEMLQIPYGNGNYVMKVVLPKQGVDFKAFASQLTTDYYNRMSKGNEAAVTLSMPRFDVSTGNLLMQTVKKLGLNRLVMDNMLSMPVSYEEIIQNARIIVNEEGTEAAAVTGGSYVSDGTNQQVTPRVRVDLNRPFIFFIEETSTNTILFSGKVVKF